MAISPLARNKLTSSSLLSSLFSLLLFSLSFSAANGREGRDVQTDEDGGSAAITTLVAVSTPPLNGPWGHPRSYNHKISNIKKFKFYA
jgi:hypothetical protein